MSYHIILNNGYYFKSVQDIKHFILFLYEIAKKRDFLNCLETELGFVIDMGIYTKNRLFKLPYQSKSGSTRVHTPSSKRQQNITLDKWLICNYSNKDIKYYDVSNIEIEGLGIKKNITGRDGKQYTGLTWSIDILKEYLIYLPKNKIINKTIKNIDDIVMSIYNGPEISSYNIFIAIGMAINRIFQGSNEGLKLWKKWADQYKETSLSELHVLYSRFNTKKGYGYSTLKMLASQCNKNITDKDHTYTLFDIETLKHLINVIFLIIMKLFMILKNITQYMLNHLWGLVSLMHYMNYLKQINIIIYFIYLLVGLLHVLCLVNLMMTDLRII